jgi:uncharacterized membrane protein
MPRPRVAAIDLVRGVIMIIMALDHTRDWVGGEALGAPTRLATTTPALFFTRWITHFCAPVFVLLAGTSAGLMTAQKTPNELGAFLLKRGIWLILIEWFVIATAFTFAPFGIAQIHGLILVPLQTIWAIGASMVALAAFQFLGRRSCLVIGAAIVVGHNALDPVWPVSHNFDVGSPLWVSLHAQMSTIAGPFQVVFAYPVLPWIGVMLLGFGIAGIFEKPAALRDRWLRRAGLATTALFVIVRALDVYGDPHGWQRMPQGVAATVMAFLNTTKYPPSLQFLLMTLGPAAIACSYADRLQGAIKDALVMFGRVPFAFYVAHFYLIHVLSMLLGVAMGFDARQFLTFFAFFPKGYGIGLPAIYAVWLLVIALLYPLCRWVERVKARRNDWWLSYL